MMGTLVSSAIVHVSLVWWWWWWSSRRGLHEKAAEEAAGAEAGGADEAASAPKNSYQVLGEAMPHEQVRDMQSQACDIDETLLASEDPVLAKTPSQTLHPFHGLLTRPTTTDKPGLLPYSKQTEDNTPTTVTDNTPTTVTVPLFTTPAPANGWTVNERHAEEDMAQSFCSDVPSDVSSSIILSVEEAHKYRQPTWAPKPLQPLCQCLRVGRKASVE